MTFPDAVIRLPDWVAEWFGSLDRIYPSLEGRMALAVELSRRNIEHETGGPFGACIFERDTGKLLAPGVNLVITQNCSVLHAEIVAITIAQRMVGTFDLGAEGRPACELVTSMEPCAMCLGAIPWSGVHRVICGARDEDARALGFDEGAKPPNWPGALAQRGIAVVRDVCREDARAVLQQYVRNGGIIYNGRQGTVRKEG